jgi:aspartate aminotransferase
MTSTLNPALDEIPFSAFEDLERRVAASGASDVVKLHQGKTTFAPCGPGDTSRFPMQAHEHAPPGGVPALKARIAEHLEARGHRVRPDDVIVTGGSTNAIATVLHCILQPGDEVLLLSPQWLFAAGLVAAAGGRPVEVPVFLELSRRPDFDLIAALERCVGPRTRALYFNTPNNPTGYSLTAPQLDAIARFAEQHDLWIISDNAYENYDHSEAGFIEISTLRAAAQRMFSIYTLSKTYAMPGYRVGWIVSPPELAPRLRKWSLYSIYSLSTAAQAAAANALATPADELARRKALAREARDLALRSLAIPHTHVAGGLYTFLDLTSWRDGDLDAFLDTCVAAGVTVAPGVAFGRHCHRHARLCFTAVTTEALQRGIERLNRVYGAR